MGEWVGLMSTFFQPVAHKAPGYFSRDGNRTEHTELEPYFGLSEPNRTNLT